MNYFNIVGIDPGNNLGISIYTINSSDLTIVSISTKYYNLDSFVDSNDDNRFLFRLQYLANIINNICVDYNPIMVGVEAAFMNIRFPKAVMQLSQYIAIIEHTIYNYNNRIKLFRYAPKYIKKFIGAGGDADKNDMSATLGGDMELLSVLPVRNYTEHELDAIAIGKVLLIEIREYPYLLYMQ